MAYAAIAQLASAVAITTSLRRENLLALYRLFVLPLLEYPIKNLGCISPKMARRIDTAQRRCLALCAGRGGAFASGPALREIMGEFETMDERRERRCAGFARSLLLSMVRFPASRGVLAGAFVGEDRADSSTSAALQEHKPQNGTSGRPTPGGSGFAGMRNKRTSPAGTPSSRTRRRRCACSPSPAPP